MARIEFLADDIVAEAEPGEKLIDITKRSGASIPFGCTNGICGTCISTVVNGKENLSPMEPREEQTLEMFGADDGEHRLVCQCRANGDVSLDNP